MGFHMSRYNIYSIHIINQAANYRSIKKLLEADKDGTTTFEYFTNNV